jgi:hypothetical protein
MHSLKARIERLETAREHAAEADEQCEFQICIWDPAAEVEACAPPEMKGRLARVRSAQKNVVYVTAAEAMF